VSEAEGVPQLVKVDALEIHMGARDGQVACIPGEVGVIDDHVELIDVGAVPSHTEYPNRRDVIPADIIRAVEGGRRGAAVV
jgi:hypothetical protein